MHSCILYPDWSHQRYPALRSRFEPTALALPAFGLELTNEMQLHQSAKEGATAEGAVLVRQSNSFDPK
jgi:hypothetical protein